MGILPLSAMSFAHLLRLARNTEPRELPGRLAGWIWHKALARIQRLHDLHTATLLSRDEAGTIALSSPIAPVTVQKLAQAIPNELAEFLAKRYLSHRFDLLGSGWCNTGYAAQVPGLEGIKFDSKFQGLETDRDGQWLYKLLRPVHAKEARRIWQMIEPPYSPIDWQRDFKSGYRWDSRRWYREQREGIKPGADIKMPWELARAQHLPQLALIAVKQPQQAKTIQREVRNQILDFIAVNPPRMGVNWHCSMDVAIRIANWLLTRELLLGAGLEFDPDFERVLSTATFQHASHIATNLEWSRTLRSNHYLANICGLAFAVSALPQSPRTDAWLALAIQELIRETRRQFHPEGSNFEGSTSYHRLSAEMAIYASARIQGLPGGRLASLAGCDPGYIKGQPALSPEELSIHSRPEGMQTIFPPGHFQTLSRLAAFTGHCTRPDGDVVQIGDNDNGRFFKILPSFRRADGRWVERHQDHRHLAGALSGLITDKALPLLAGPFLVEGELVAALSGLQDKFAADKPDEAPGSIGTHEALKASLEYAKDLPPPYRKQFDFDLNRPGITPRCLAYPDFGLYLYRSEQLFLAIRCGPLGQQGHGGHNHNDQLALELWIDGRPRVLDPGTYLYTPLPERRNQYRSVRAHFTPRIAGREPASLKLGLFELGKGGEGECLYFGPDGFIGRHRGFGQAVYRIVLMSDAGVKIIDYTEGPRPLDDIYRGDNLPASLPYSPGYGLSAPSRDS